MVTNQELIELKVLRVAKTCVILHFCFVSDVLRPFFFQIVLVFYKKIFLEEVTSKYTKILHILGTFSDILGEKASRGSMLMA